MQKYDSKKQERKTIWKMKKKWIQQIQRKQLNNTKKKMKDANNFLNTNNTITEGKTK